MKIETKYNIGDKVFVLTNDEIKECTVVYINTRHSKHHEPSIRYGIEYPKVNSYGELERPEETCFATKEGLLKSL